MYNYNDNNITIDTGIIIRPTNTGTTISVLDFNNASNTSSYITVTESSPISKIKKVRPSYEVYKTNLHKNYKKPVFKLIKIRSI